MTIFLNIPILNEFDNIEPLLDRIEHALDGQDYIVLLIDDGSTDGTLEKIGRRMVANQSIRLMQRKKERSGCQRGGALFDGMLWGLQNTSCSVFVEMDGDLSHRPEELAEGLDMVRRGSFDMVVASKYLKGGKTVSRPFGRRAVSAVCNIAVRSLLDWKVMDYSNGYRFYDRPAAALLSRYKFRYTSPIYLSEVMAILLRNQSRVGEFPTKYVGRNEGFSKLRFIDLAKAAVAIFEISWRYHVSGFTAQDGNAAKAKSATRSLVGNEKSGACPE